MGIKQTISEKSNNIDCLRTHNTQFAWLQGEVEIRGLQFYGWKSLSAKLNFENIM
jgi:hypothetical protein